MSSALARTTYSQLVKDISILYENARRGQIRFAWETGRRIVEVEQDGNIRAEYGAGLIRALADDLTETYGPGSGFSETNLKCMRQLYRLNPKGAEKSPHADLLTWSDQRELMTVRDGKARQRLVKRIAGKGLSRDELRALVRQETGGNGRHPEARRAEGSPVLKPLIRPTDLKLHTFKVAKPEVAALKPVPKGQVLIDCGFFSYRPVEKSALEAEGQLTDTPSYTYSATIERVIDGDTLLVLIDTGFENVLEEKLRLRGINTPELGTPEGERAKKFVQKLLPVGSTIVLKSHKCSTDTYGRFVVDVFYGDGDPDAIIANGEYLNQVLLDKGYAERMAE